MIAFIEGSVRLIRSGSIVLDVQGIGYEVHVNNPYGFKLGENIFLYTYQHIREDASLLYGFLKEEDYEVFMRLINVKGIGPRIAQNMLGACSGADMIQAIENDDVKRLKALPGIGAKTASQIVLDLKGKFVSAAQPTSAQTSQAWQECQEALLSLGYKTSQLSVVQKELGNLEMDVSEMLRQALALLAKRNGV